MSKRKTFADTFLWSNYENVHIVRGNIFLLKLSDTLATRGEEPTH